MKLDSNIKINKKYIISMIPVQNVHDPHLKEKLNCISGKLGIFNCPEYNRL